MDDGALAVASLPCDAAGKEPSVTKSDASRGLDPGNIRLVSWNIHKQADAGWQRDLRRLGIGADLVLLQESVLGASLRETIDDEGFRWIMASSFLRSGLDIGVLTASRVQPIANCTERTVEPLLRIPKSAVISWFPLAGRRQSLAVVNVHAINFSLSLGAYRAQLQAIQDVLAQHRGPLIVAGDLNTWTAARSDAVRSLATGLGLTEVSFASDRRSHFFGHELDHIYTRGLVIVASTATAVTSSDHNPVAATLRLAHGTNARSRSTGASRCEPVTAGRWKRPCPRSASAY